MLTRRWTALLAVVSMMAALVLVPSTAATAETGADGTFQVSGTLHGRWGPYRGFLRAYPKDGYLNHQATADGTFTFESSDTTRARGPILLWVEGNQDYRGGWYAGPGELLAADKGDAVELTGTVDLGVVEMEATPWIAGTVTTGAGPAAGASVLVIDPTPGAWPRDWSTTADPDGRFRVSGIAEGVPHLVQVREGDPAVVGGYYTGPGGTASQLESDAAGVMPFEEIDVRLQDAVTIRGSVTALRPPSPYPPQVMAYEMVQGAAEFRSSTFAAADGAYELPGLRLGAQVLVCFRWRWSGESCHADDAVALVDRSAATPVTAPADGLESVYLAPALGINPPTVDRAPRVGERITATNDQCVSYGCSFVWLRDGTPITGATRAAYVPVAADHRRTLSVRVTVHPAGHWSSQATHVAGTVALGPAPRAAALPTITGTPRVGGTLRATSPSWSPAGVTVSYQWYRGTTRIAGATQAAYRVVPVDAGQRLKVVVSAAKAGYATGKSSQTIDVAKVVPVLQATLPRTKVYRTSRAVVDVVVTAQGLTPTGRVVVSSEGWSTSASLPASAGGKVRVRLPQLRPGSYGLVVKFVPDTASARSMTGVTRTDRTLVVT